jgi:hypothetical protein
MQMESQSRISNVKGCKLGGSIGIPPPYSKRQFWHNTKPSVHQLWFNKAKQEQNKPIQQYSCLY